MLVVCAVCCFSQVSANAGNINKQTEMTTDKSTHVLIETSLGTIEIALYDKTPLHRDNFLKLVAEKYYDGVLFHRVIKDFMIQTGDGSSKNAKPGQMLGHGDLDYTVPAEILYPELFHKKGVLAAARTADQVNPERRSSASQFYIVTGQVYNLQQLQQMNVQKENRAKQEIFQRLTAPHRKELMKMNMAGDTAGIEAVRQQIIKQTEEEYAASPVMMSQAEIEAYSTVGGTPHLDGAYTVFGEVVKGMDVVERIQAADTDRNDRPKDDIKILKMTVLK